jgi:hypothetical protein
MTENCNLWITPSIPPETDYNAIIWSSELACTNVVDTLASIMDHVKYTIEFIKN